MAREKINDILLGIAASAADKCVDLSLCFVDPYGVQKGKYQNGANLSSLVSKKSARNAIQRLKDKGCLERIEKNGRILYRITEIGRSRIEKYLFDQETWDGKWRIVMFDIPEEQKKLRNALRSILKRCRFKQFQRSVWISPFDVLDEVEKYVDENNLHKEVWYFLANSSKNDDSMIEMFLNQTKI